MASKTQSQRGGFFIGMVVGLLVGLALALGVALYVNKVPIPFVDKVPQRTAEQDAAEALKNKDWNPNAPLAGKMPAPPASAPVAASAPAAPEAKTVPVASAASAASAPAAGASKAPAEAMQFFVQVGAYARSEDAEQQRAKLGLSGMVGRISEREQAGKLIYRVRLGPFDQRDDAEAVRHQVAEAGYPDATLVRVQPQN